MMEEAYAFALRGELIEFTLQRIREGKATPPSLFQNVMLEKCRLVNHHFANTRDHLKLASNVTDTATTITFYNNLIEDSKIKTVIISNTPNLETQLVHLWCNVQRILKYFNEEDRIAEMDLYKDHGSCHHICRCGRNHGLYIEAYIGGTFHTSCLICRNYSREMSPYQLSFFES